MHSESAQCQPSHKINDLVNLVERGHASASVATDNTWPVAPSKIMTVKCCYTQTARSHKSAVNIQDSGSQQYERWLLPPPYWSYCKLHSGQTPDVWLDCGMCKSQWLSFRASADESKHTQKNLTAASSHLKHRSVSCLSFVPRAAKTDRGPVDVISTSSSAAAAETCYTNTCSCLSVSHGPGSNLCCHPDTSGRIECHSVMAVGGVGTLGVCSSQCSITHFLKLPR